MNEENFTPNEQPILEPKKNNIVLIVIIVAIVAITAGVIGFLLAKKTQAPATAPAVTQPVAQTPLAQPADETAGWQEYSSKNLNIKFKYPMKYVFLDRTDGDEKAILIGDKTFSKPDIAPWYHAPITISKYNAELLNDQIATLYNVKKSTLTIDNEDANVIEGNYQNYPAPSVPADKHMKIIVVPSKNITILAQDSYAGVESDWNEVTSVVNKLLTTIKFTNTVTSETVNCETYNKSYFEIKELGIKFLVDKSIKNDLIYEYSKPTVDSFKGDLGVVKFSTKSLISIDTDCSANSGTIGTMNKIKGKPSDYADGQGTDKFLENGLVKQFDNFFIRFVGPQATCGDEKNIQKTTDLANRLRNEYFLQDLDCITTLN